MPCQGERKTVVTNELIKVRTNRGGSGWLTVVWDSFIGMLLFFEPVGSIPWAVLHIT